MFWGRSTAKDSHPVSLLSVVSKVSEKLVNDRIVDHLEKCGLFSDFQYGSRSSRSTADLLTVVSDRIARAFNIYGTLELWHLIYQRFLTGLMMLSVIMLSMLMIVLSILSVIRHLICSKNLNWLLNLKLVCETL